MTDVFPDVIRIETSGKCNFRCKHCCNGQNQPDRALLSQEIFDIIIKQFVDNHFIPRVVVLYHGGEPLLNKKLSDYIKTIKLLGVNKVKIVTNAALLTKTKAQELINAGLTDIDFSFDGVSPDENNMIRTNGNFERDSENVINFMKLCKEQNYKIKAKICNVQICTKIQLEHYKNSKSLQPPEYILEKFKEYIDMLNFDVFPAMVWPGYDAVSSNYKIIEGSRTSNKICKSAFETFTVCSNGDVVPCCYDIKGSFVLGNIINENIFDIWNNPKYTKFRENMKKFVFIDICQNCVVNKEEYLVKP